MIARAQLYNIAFFLFLFLFVLKDTAYGGYCVFAVVEGVESDATMNRIAEEVKQKGTVNIIKMELVS